MKHSTHTSRSLRLEAQENRRTVISVAITSFVMSLVSGGVFTLAFWQVLGGNDPAIDAGILVVGIALWLSSWSFGFRSMSALYDRLNARPTPTLGDMPAGVDETAVKDKRGRTWTAILRE